MAESTPAPAVALLFADAGLGAHLREALQALSARIVHEGPADVVRREDLASADVVVVNLDAALEDNLERLYDVLDESRQRVVFNDAAASRGLSGWDRARWARHLAAKLLDAGDVDPPRPADARIVEAAGADGDGVPPSSEAQDGDVGYPPPGVDNGASATTDVPVDGVGDTETLAGAADASETDALAAELEALLAEGDGMPADVDIVPAAELELSLEPGPDLAGEVADDGLGDVPVADAPRREVPEAPPGLSLVPQDDDEEDAAVPVEQRQVEPVAPPVADWDLVDFDAEPAPPPATPDASEFGIEKLAASEFLAPEGGADDSMLEPGLSLELESIEEAIAPRVDDAPVHEMHLGDSSSAIRRVVLLGAAAEGSAPVVEFLASLPDVLPALVVLVQHQAGQSTAALADALAAVASLPVRAAEDGMRARQGEVVVLPAGHGIALGRDGSLRLQPVAGGPCDPSIDQCFTAVAATFGADVTGIIFAGDTNDAVAGAQAVRDRGGRVWAQDPGTCQANAMIVVAQEEGLVDFVGAPEELAMRLRGEYT